MKELKEGDVVLCTVEKIVGTTVFVKIEDNGQGSIIVSEIAPGRIRNLRDYVVPNKKIVCKILRIGKDYANLSLRRVVENERKEVLDICSYIKVLSFYIKLHKKIFTEPHPMIAIEGSSLEGDIKRLYYLPPVSFSAIENEIMSHILHPYKLFTDGKVLEDMLRRLMDENSKKKFLKLFEVFLEIANSDPTMSLSDAIGYILEKGGYLDLYQKGAFQTEQGKESVRFALAVKEEAADFERVRGGVIPLYEKIDMFIESISMRGKSTEQSALKTVDDYVNVMSLHAAKGLEFNTVFFIGLEENIIPIKHFSEEKISKKEKEKRIEEERRLFYVGLTRAKERLFLTYADTRKWYGKPQQFEPSQFLNCLPGKLLDKGSFAVGFWEKFKYFFVKLFR
ncbi:MAG: 3'-5' exonuclease [Elusimicrobiota bacterium]|nr:3'-5' exonuclease [Elusimicrobiota bacterium]